MEFGWSLAAAARVSLLILDVRGRVVRSIAAPRTLSGGVHRASWDGSDERSHAMGTGIYFARLTVDGRSFEQRVPILR